MDSLFYYFILTFECLVILQCSWFCILQSVIWQIVKRYKMGEKRKARKDALYGTSLTDQEHQVPQIWAFLLRPREGSALVPTWHLPSQVLLSSSSLLTVPVLHQSLHMQPWLYQSSQCRFPTFFLSASCPNPYPRSLLGASPSLVLLQLLSSTVK